MLSDIVDAKIIGLLPEIRQLPVLDCCCSTSGRGFHTVCMGGRVPPPAQRLAVVREIQRTSGLAAIFKRLLKNYFRFDKHIILGKFMI